MRNTKTYTQFVNEGYSDLDSTEKVKLTQTLLDTIDSNPLNVRSSIKWCYSELVSALDKLSSEFECKFEVGYMRTGTYTTVTADKELTDEQCKRLTKDLRELKWKCGDKPDERAKNKTLFLIF